MFTLPCASIQQATDSFVKSRGFWPRVPCYCSEVLLLILWKMNWTGRLFTRTAPELKPARFLPDRCKKVLKSIKKAQKRHFDAITHASRRVKEASRRIKRASRFVTLAFRLVKESSRLVKRASRRIMHASWCFNRSSRCITEASRCVKRASCFFFGKLLSEWDRVGGFFAVLGSLVWRPTMAS